VRAGLRRPDLLRVETLDGELLRGVSTEEVGGRAPGRGHDLRIEAVDEPMADHLFRPPAGPRGERASGGEQGVLAQ
jgi:hypothetical protein